MSGIAEILANLGYAVSGSDARTSEVTKRLATMGVEVHEGHAAGQVGAADVVVVSAAVRSDNPEVVEARQRGIPVIPRAEMLAELMRLRSGIAVAGAHGKTTTTSMISLMLERAGLDPTAVIGGRLSAFGSNARLGRGEYMVAEADESDGSFLKLAPTFAIITNVDREHLEHYGSYEHLLNAFVDFANRVPFYGAVVICADDPRLRELRGRMTRRVLTYGLDSRDRDVAGTDVSVEPYAVSCLVSRRASGAAEGGPDGRLQLRVPGRHNLLNALASVTLGFELGLDFGTMALALAEFQGAERRFQRLGQAGGVTVVDDYGHHPTEIEAVIAAARTSHQGRVVVVFQPHRYTRTQLLMDDFASAFHQADNVCIVDIYAASEPPIEGVTSAALVRRLQDYGHRSARYAASLGAAVEMIAREAAAGDAVLTLGAGNIWQAGDMLLQALKERK